MGYQLTQEDNYNLLTLSAEAFGSVSQEKLNIEVLKALKTSPYLIVNCKELKALGNAETSLFKDWYSQAKKASGNLLVTAISSTLEPQIEKLGIHCIPTDDEAVDYLFMDQLEKEFHDDDDDDDF